MNWPQKRIGNFLIESSIETSAPSADRRIRVLLNAEGIEKRPLIAETEGATRYFQRKAGQFIYGKQNLHKGAFGVVPPELDGFESSSDLPAFDVADGLRPKWLEYFLKQGNFYKSLVAIAKGAATKRIQPEALFDVELPVPPTKVQDEIIKRMDRCALEHTRLEHEITHEQCLLTKLKQAILQEAIQGKLTADWRRAYPDVEPASQLLRRIQGEKAHLIAAKKLRPEKPLPKITPAEIPFEIPKGWEWCRLGQVVILKSGNAYLFRETGDTDAVPYIKVGDMNIDGNREDATQSSTYFEYDEAMESQFIPRKSIIFPKRGGAIATNKRCKVLSKSILVDSNTMAMCPSEFLSFDFVFTWFSHIDLAKFGNNSVLPQVNNKDILPLMFPLPPLAEQAAIVERVEALMTTCRALEAETDHARTQSAQLLQAVLVEAFSKVF
jgi:type I restriction enzyme S subunit